MAIQPVILSGGAGTRLWPMSRQDYPKQLLPLVSAVSMIRDTLERVKDPALYADPMIITGDALRFSVAEEARLSGQKVSIILEPSARNTAPAVTASALMAAETDPETILLVMPSDHVIADGSAFQKLVALGAEAAAEGWLITFAMTPTRPETGYGYIKVGQPLAHHPDVHRVDAFVEKPDAIRAQAFIERGDHYWNSGMFLFKASSFIEEIAHHAPEVLSSVKAAIAAKASDLDFIRLHAESFAQAPSISIDYAVMEHTQKAATLLGDMGWTDVGSWSELWSIGPKDQDDTVTVGDVISHNSKGCYVRSEGPMVAVSNIENLVVVATDDAVLVTTRDNAQDVKLLVEKLRQSGRSEHATHTRVHRPWGYYQTLHDGERFQVKRLTVKPGAKISLQKHFRRAEHWVVVNGVALVTRDDQTHTVRENESIHIPLGAIHRLENPGDVPLTVIEVQSGEYLGEDDIVRLVDTYGRT